MYRKIEKVFEKAQNVLLVLTGNRTGTDDVCYHAADTDKICDLLQSSVVRRIIKIPV